MRYDACDGDIDGPGVPRQSAGGEKRGDLEHRAREALNERVGLGWNGTTTFLQTGMSEAAIQRDQPLSPRLQSQSKKQPRPLGHDIFHYRQRSSLRPLKIPISSPRKSTSGPSPQRKTISHQHPLDLLLSRARRTLLGWIEGGPMVLEEMGHTCVCVSPLVPIHWSFSPSRFCR